MSTINGITVVPVNYLCSTDNTLDTSIFSLDGNNIQTGDIVLFSRLSDSTLNGIYTATRADNTTTWARTVGYTTSNDYKNGLYVTISDGNIYGDTMWYISPDPAFILGTSILDVKPTKASAIMAVIESSGANVTSTLAAGSNLIGHVDGAGVAGAVVVGNPVLVGGSDGTNTRIFKTDNAGALTIIANQDSRTAGTITTASSTAFTVSVINRNLATITISGTYAGVTFVIECSDDGTNYYPAQSINNSNGVAATNGTWTPGTNAVASYDLAIGGYTNLRVRSTAWGSGTANVGCTLQTFAYDPVVAAITQGIVPSGVAALGNPVLAGGVYTSTLPTYTTGMSSQIQTNAKGVLYSHIHDGTTAAGVIVATTALKTDKSSIAGVATLVGNGVTGTGSQRVTIASDNTPYAIKIDQTTPGTTDSVTIKPSTVKVTASFTRPAEHATAYSSGDVMGVALSVTTSAITFAGIGPIGKVIRITGSRLEIDTAPFPSGMTSFRLHLYNVTPPSALFDNAAWDLPSGDRASYLGYVELGTIIDVGSTLYVQQTNLGEDFLMGATTNLYGYLVTNGGYLPSDSIVNSITLYAMVM